MLKFFHFAKKKKKIWEGYIYFKGFIYLFEMKETEREYEREREIHPPDG